MKKIFTLYALLLTTILLAQAPQKMTYQSVVHNPAVELVADASIGI